MKNFKQKVEKVRIKNFPIELANGFRAELTDFATIRDFVNKNFSKAFNRGRDDIRFSMHTISKSRMNNCRLIVQDRTLSHEDYILFLNAKNDVVGWCMGETSDHVTYYMRNTGILKKYQNRGIYKEFLPIFCEYLKQLGYERITSHHSGDNKPILITKIKNDFKIVGIENREDFGNLVIMTKLLMADRRKKHGIMFP